MTRKEQELKGSSQDHRPEIPDPEERRERSEWFLGSRLSSDSKEISRGLFASASRHRRRLERKENRGEPPPTPPGGPGTANWTPIGPSVVAHGQASGNPPVSGRVNAIAVGPGGLRVYAGAANGGVWFSGDGGATWSPVDDYAVSPSSTSGLEADSLSVGAIAVRFGASAATDTVFVGTGEPGGAGDAYFGVGIKFSPSGGAPGTWNLEATNLAGKGIYRIVIDPDDPSVVYAATSSGLFRRPTAAPFTTWGQITSVTFTNANGSASDLIVAGSGASKRYYAAFDNDRVYSSADPTAWTALAGITGAGRTVLAAGENDPTVVYALGANGSLYRLVGTVFQTVSGMPPLFNGGQGWYDIALGVDAANANTVYLIGDLVWDGDWTLSFFKGTITSSAAGFTFPFNSTNNGNPAADPTFIGRGVHADGHAFALALNAAATGHDGTNVWVGTDGGIFQSNSSGAFGTFLPRNEGLAITEMTYLAQRPDTDAALFAGCQDNGNLRSWGEQPWFESPEGDGGGVAFDPNDQYRIMRQYVRAGRFRGGFFYGGLYATSDGGASGSWNVLTFPPYTSTSTAQQNAVNAENSATGFYSPIAVSPLGVTPTLAAFGTNRLWLTADWGSTWVTLPTGTNPYVPAAPNALQDVLDGNPVTAIAFASGTRIYAATFNAIWRFDRSGASWTRTPITTTGLPTGHYISAIAVDNAAGGSFYVALGRSGFDHVWFFDGTNWHTAGPGTATLDIPCHAITTDPANPNIIYLGSDVGCWKGIRTGTATWTWTLFSQGLPEAAITDMGVHSRARLLRVATHGRGVWEFPIDAATSQDPDIYLRVNYADTGRTPGGARFPWVEGAQDPTARGFDVYHWMSPDIKVRRGSLVGLPPLGSQADYLNFSTNIGDYIDSSTHIETADVSGPDRIFVEVHNRSLTPLPGSQVRVLLLLTDASAGLPPLPSNYAAHINAADASSAWLGSDWRFADPVTPYRTLPGILDVRTPQVVEYDVDFSTLGLPATDDHVCAAAFITTVTTADRLTSVVSSLDQLTMQDKHVAHRNLHLVAAGARPSPRGSEFKYVQSPRTILVDFFNPSEVTTIVDLVFDHERFPGHLSLLLSKVDYAGGREAVRGFEVIHHGNLEVALATHFGRWLERVGELVEQLGESVEQLGAGLAADVVPHDVRRLRASKLAGLDSSRVFVADTSPVSVISRVQIPGRRGVTAAITIQAPPNAVPGDRFRLGVLQKSGGKIVGGSSYVIAVTKEHTAAY